MAKSKVQPKWTIVQHSGFGYGGKPGFEKAIETRQVSTLKEQTTVLKAGGLLFDDWKTADDYENDPKVVGEGMYPRVPGTFSNHEIDGLKIYVPPKKG
jgi:hypothetical protein